MATLDDGAGTVTMTSSLRFFQDDSKFEHEKPYHFSGPLEPHEECQRTNLILKPRDDVAVKDLRSNISPPQLHIHGFEFMTQPSAFLHRLHETETLQKYMEETAEIVQETLGAKAAICYDYRFRRSTTTPGCDIIGSGGSFHAPNEPAWQVHVDMTKDAGPKRARYHLQNTEHSQYLDGNWRLRILNAWRPLNHVRDSPLAFCDFTSVDHRDLVAVDRPSKEYTGEVYYLRYAPEQKWYWLSEQTPDELALFMSYDSHPDEGGAALCPHSAFQITRKSDGTPSRESLELRFIVVNAIKPYD